MESSQDKQWASRYLLDPLTAPEPSQETGPGTSFNSSFAKTPSSTTSSQRKPTPSASVRSVDSSVAPAKGQKPTPAASTRSSNNPYRKGTNGYPSPPPSAGPQNERFPNFDGSYSPSRRSVDQASTQIPTSTGGQTSSTTTGAHRRRTSSLSQRFQGDQTHQPLDMLRNDAKKAQRSPHLRKKHHVGADSIDSLDTISNGYHHEGPYDATLLAKNLSSFNSPVQAVSDSNREALRATPRENIQDSIEKHRPLDGVAMIPPGSTDRFGRRYDYQEGTDMMIEGNPEGGAYKRWPGVKYLPEDLKGKGEPSYSLEKALKEDKSLHRRNASEGIEMTTPAEQRRPMSTTTEGRRASDGAKYAGMETGMQRAPSGSGKLRKRFGSLKVKE